MPRRCTDLPSGSLNRQIKRSYSSSSGSDENSLSENERQAINIELAESEATDRHRSANASRIGILSEDPSSSVVPCPVVAANLSVMRLQK
ncbi:hypothetical protein I302_104397 [Kwoniella bestiolae CBS 10118]|uniref:Uncharacterized protein n=1 Tax=Kwoniella bestiolae CBS 10118 TaxID=1296100 RepID=A0AAJ8K7U1_9TREE